VKVKSDQRKIHNQLCWGFKNS